MGGLWLDPGVARRAELVSLGIPILSCSVDLKERAGVE